MWTSEIPTAPGWYLWRIEFPGEPPTVEPFLIYDAFGVARVQEFGGWRERAYGAWDLDEWVWRLKNPDEVDAARRHPTMYLRLGPPEVDTQLVRAFRELYHAAFSAWQALKWTPDLSENGAAVINELAAALNEIHKEF